MLKQFIPNSDPKKSAFIKQLVIYCSALVLCFNIRINHINNTVNSE